MTWFRAAWWTLWHPVDALLVVLFTVLFVAAPELALLLLFIAWSHNQRRGAVFYGPTGRGKTSFVMRDA